MGAARRDGGGVGDGAMAASLCPRASQFINAAGIRLPATELAKSVTKSRRRTVIPDVRLPELRIPDL